MSKSHKYYGIFLTLIFFSMSAFSYTPQFADAEKTIPVRWDKKVIVISISDSLLNNPVNIKSDENILEVINNTLTKWQNAGDIQFRFTISDKQSVSPEGKFGDGISLITIAQTPENILLFGEKANNTSAITKVFYDENGNISEADIVLNPIHLFSTDGTFGTFDLEATLTHELGHLIGLDHSRIIGSVMHIHQGKNGVYDLPRFNAQNISEDDTAGLISLYGKKPDDVICCGQMKGQIKAKTKQSIEEFHIWAEEAETGKVIAGVSTNSDGEFSIQGLNPETYNLFAQPINRYDLLSTIYLGQFALDSDEVITVNKKVNIESNNFDIRYVGLNGQLSTISVPVSSGETIVLYVGGNHFNSNDFDIFINSPYFKIDKKSYVEHEFENGIVAISFDVSISQNAKTGNYSIKIKNKKDRTAYLVGSISVTNLPIISNN